VIIKEVSRQQQRKRTKIWKWNKRRKNKNGNEKEAKKNYINYFFFSFREVNGTQWE
jgi:hypothetical protein